MTATAVTKYFDRPEQLVDITTTYNNFGVTAGPSFNLGVRQARDITIQVDWQNNTGNIDIIFFSRTKPGVQYDLMKLIDENNKLVDSIKMSDTSGSHMIHINKKFNDIDIRFVINNGQANVKVSGIVE